MNALMVAPRNDQREICNSLLTDPLVRTMMAADGVDAMALSEMLNEIVATLDRRGS